MADISKIILPNKSSYNVKDASARAMPSAYYGTCATAAATAAKVVTVSSDQNFVLKAGAVIGVKFTYTNTASSCTINVNSTGAKSIWYNTAAYTGTDSGVCGYANRTIYYMYNGTYWVHLSYGYNTNGNIVPTAYSGTAAGTAAKWATCTNYNLLAKSYTILLITTTNTAASALTLNINGKGAKPIYINGSASSSSNHTMPAGSYLVYYDGTNYYIRTDGKITGDITGNAATVNGKTVGVNVPADAKFTDTVVTKTSELTNDSNFAVDANYVHTDNNYTTTEKNKLSGIATGAEANVQSDWNVTDTASDAYIKNKPTIPTIPANIVTDANYVHTDNNFTTTEKNKLSGIATGAEANVQSDWNETDTSSDAYILNKPNPYLLENFIAIPDGSDLNDYTTPGEYYVSSESTSVSHCPRSGFAFRLRVENNPTASYTKQTFFIRVNSHSYSSPITWFRFYRADTQVWGSWMGDTQHLMGYINLHDDDDLNDFIELGEYECTLNSRALTITNRPSDMNVAFRLRVEAGIQGYNGSTSTYLYRRQTLYPYNSSNIYYTRTYIIEGAGTASWSSWIKCGVPISHASTATTYGQGDASNYGHVKLSDTYSSKVSGGNAAGGVAASQNALYNVYDGITSGSIVAGKAASLQTTNTDGVYTDEWGSFIHKSTSANNWWAVKKHDKTADSFRVYYETGKIMAGGKTIVYAAGDNPTIEFVTTGFLTSSQKSIVLSVPVITASKYANIKTFSCVMRHSAGGYIYMCYGSSNNKYLQLGTGRQTIVDNTVGVHEHGCNNYSAAIKNTAITITLSFYNTLRTNAGTNTVTNNTPISIDCLVTFQFYDSF